MELNQAPKEDKTSKKSEKTFPRQFLRTKNIRTDEKMETLFNPEERIKKIEGMKRNMAAALSTKTEAETKAILGPFDKLSGLYKEYDKAMLATEERSSEIRNQILRPLGEEIVKGNRQLLK